MYKSVRVAVGHERWHVGRLLWRRRPQSERSAKLEQALALALKQFKLILNVGMQDGNEGGVIRGRAARHVQRGAKGLSGYLLTGACSVRMSVSFGLPVWSGRRSTVKGFENTLDLQKGGAMIMLQVHVYNAMLKAPDGEDISYVDVIRRGGAKRERFILYARLVGTEMDIVILDAAKRSVAVRHFHYPDYRLRPELNLPESEQKLLTLYINFGILFHRELRDWLDVKLVPEDEELEPPAGGTTR